MVVSAAIAAGTAIGTAVSAVGTGLVAIGSAATGGAAGGITAGVIGAGVVAGSAATLASAVGAFNPDIQQPQVTPAAVIVDQQQELQRRAAGIGKAGRAGTVLTSGRGLADDTLVASRPRLLGESTGSPAR